MRPAAGPRVLLSKKLAGRQGGLPKVDAVSRAPRPAKDVSVHALAVTTQPASTRPAGGLEHAKALVATPHACPGRWTLAALLQTCMWHRLLLAWHAGFP